MPIYYHGKEIGNALINYSGGGGGVTSETVACEYINETTLEFARTQSGTPLYAELTCDADTAIVYGQSYWVKSGFFFWKADGTLDLEKSFYWVYEDGMLDYGRTTFYDDSAIMLADQGSYSQLYVTNYVGEIFLPSTGDNPVQYTIKLTYG